MCERESETLKYYKTLLEPFRNPSPEIFEKLENEDFSPLHALHPDTRYMSAIDQSTDEEEDPPKRRKRKNKDDEEYQFKEEELDDEEFELEPEYEPSQGVYKVSKVIHNDETQEDSSQPTTSTGSAKFEDRDDKYMNIKESGLASEIMMQFKASRDETFSETIPDVLYTLTWKHKYDIKLYSTKDVFCAPENVLRKSISLNLVMADDLQIPKYDRNKVRKRRPNERKRKRKQKKPKDTSTIDISSVHKLSDRSLVVRFGINRTFCSKRFGYSPFRLEVRFENNDQKYKKINFVKFSTMFRTFAKKLNNDTIKNINAILMKNNSKMLIPIQEQPPKAIEDKKQSPKQSSNQSPKKSPKKAKRKREIEEIEEVKESKKVKNEPNYDDIVDHGILFFSALEKMKETVQAEL